jgi:hypothetical protein
MRLHAGGEPSHIRQTDVEDGEIKSLPPGCGEGIRAGQCVDDFKTFRFKRINEGVGYCRFIFNQ